VTIYIDHPYVEQVEFRLNQSRIESNTSAEYGHAEAQAKEIREALTGIRAKQRADAAPKRAVTCPHCLATTKPDANGCCEYCGSSLEGAL
jgi:uncharacterized paraquat-inducible protein A